MPESLSALIPNSGIENLGPLNIDDVTRALCDSCDVFQSEAENKAAPKIAETVNGHPLYMTVIISFCVARNWASLLISTNALESMTRRDYYRLPTATF